MTVLAALALSACASSPPAASAASAEDCAALMLVAGFIAEHQPPLRLRPFTRDVEAWLADRSRVEPPERWSPDVGPQAVAAIGYARWARRAPVRLHCPVDKGPFVPWRPGRAELVLSTPAYAPDGTAAVLDAAVLLPGRRIDHYRLMLTRDKAGDWDLHRIGFDSVPW